MRRQLLTLYKIVKYHDKAPLTLTIDHQNIYSGVNFCGRIFCGNFFLAGIFFADRGSGEPQLTAKGRLTDLK